MIEYEIKKGNGKKKIYEKNGQLILEAEYLNGKLNGKVKVYYEEKLTFEGEYLNNILNGKVKIYDENKLIFDVEYLNGKLWNGKDILVIIMKYLLKY